MTESIKTQVEDAQMRIRVFTLSIEELKKKIEALQNVCKHEDVQQGTFFDLGISYRFCRECGMKL